MIARLLYLGVMLAGLLITDNPEYPKKGMELFLASCVLSAAVLYETVDKKRGIMLFLEAFFILFMNIRYGGGYYFLLPVVILDLVVYFHMPYIGYFLPYAVLAVIPVDIYLYVMTCMFTGILYFQNYVIAGRLIDTLRFYEKEEYSLKNTMDYRDRIYKKELKENSLQYENNMLEEKARLSQALHDKLGHSINGSVYQLEACKVLLESNTGESRVIIQRVIDNLRGSMDEIRHMLRNERPDKRRMALIRLKNLCGDCRSRYEINAECVIEGEADRVPEDLWELILDNSYEAVSNALKYSRCKNIAIHILILHKVVRCMIKDDGIGCDKIEEGMGIQGMKERVRLHNGSITISSEAGFEINMIFPLTEKERANE